MKDSQREVNQQLAKGFFYLCVGGFILIAASTVIGSVASALFEDKEAQDKYWNDLNTKTHENSKRLEKIKKIKNQMNILYPLFDLMEQNQIKFLLGDINKRKTVSLELGLEILKKTLLYDKCNKSQKTLMKKIIINVEEELSKRKLK